jgi:hypothetical protein
MFTLGLQVLPRPGKGSHDYNTDIGLLLPDGRAITLPKQISELDACSLTDLLNIGAHHDESASMKHVIFSKLSNLFYKFFKAE